ncbi:hypothetical protein HDE_04971 [Halotydeus destructor]|nr:hypothetical protein HDE_04971 [Halotydeus destructor]
MRLDCLVSESLGALATHSEADVRIVSPVLNKIHIAERFEPLLETLVLVDVYSYLALLVTMMAVAFVMAVGQVNGNRQRLSMSRVTRHIMSSLWRIFELVVSQGKFGHKGLLLRAVWLILTFGLYVVISGFFVNMFSTQKVARRSPDQLETIEDIIGAKFNSAEPTMLAELFTYPLSKRVKKGTKESKLFDKINSNRENLYAMGSSSDGADFATSQRTNFVQEMKEAIDKKNRYLLYEDVLWKSLRPVLCHTMPENLNDTHTSRGTLLSGLITLPYRKNTDYRLKVYMEYRLKNYFEMGLSGTDYMTNIRMIVVLLGQYELGKPGSYMCLAKISPENKVSKMQFKLQHTRVFLRLLIVIFTMAVLSNIMEMVIQRRNGRVRPHVSKWSKKLTEFEINKPNSLSCSEFSTSDFSSGELGDFGNYSGTVGMIQRGEIDYASSSHMRLDCLVSESLGALATFSEADVRIVSPMLNKMHVTDRFEPLLETLALVDRYSYFALSLTLMVVALYMSVETVKRKRKVLSGSRIAKHMTLSLWRIFELVVSQGKFGQGGTLLRSVWLTLTVGLFVIVYGYFGNMLQTEKVAQRSPDQLETIEDIIGSKFNSAEPTILTDLFTYPLSKLVKRSTPEGQLFEKISSNTENLYALSPPSESTSSAMSTRGNFMIALNQGMADKNRYLLYENVLWMSLRPVLCHTMPENFKDSHISKGTLLGGLITIPYRKKSDYRLKIYMEYRLKNYFEMGLSGTDYLATFKTIFVLVQQYKLGKKDSTMCLLKISSEEEVSEMQFELQHSRVFLKLLIGIVALAVIANIIEIVIYLRRRKEISYLDSCTEVATSDVSSGEVDVYGNYTGTVGMIQRAEVDYAFTSRMRLDCLVSDSIGVLATYSEADVRIVSPILNRVVEADRFEPITETLVLFDGYFYLALCLTIVAVAICMAIGTADRNRIQPSVEQLVGQTMQCLWCIFEVFVNQGKLSHRSLPLRLVWLLLTIGAFIIISGFFINMLRTEKVAQRSPQQLETIEDILDPTFESSKPTIVTDAFTYVLRRLVKKGTREERLFRKIGTDKDNLYSLNLSANNSDLAANTQANFFLAIHAAMESRNRYLLLEDVLWKSLRPVLCCSMPDAFEHSHFSKATLLGGLIILPYRKSTDYRLKTFMEHRLKNHFEFGLSRLDYLEAFETIFTLAGQWEFGKPGSHRCLAGKHLELEVSEMQFELRHTRGLFKLLVAILGLAGLFNVREVSRRIHCRNGSKKGKNKNTKRVKKDRKPGLSLPAAGSGDRKLSRKRLKY